MNGIKNILASKTVLTTIIGIILTIGQMAGFVDPTVTVEAITTALFTLAGYFRFIAVKQLVVGTTA